MADSAKGKKHELGASCPCNSLVFRHYSSFLFIWSTFAKIENPARTCPRASELQLPETPVGAVHMVWSAPGSHDHLPSVPLITPWNSMMINVERRDLKDQTGETCFSILDVEWECTCWSGWPPQLSWHQDTRHGPDFGLRGGRSTHSHWTALFWFGVAHSATQFAQFARRLCTF